MIEIQLNGKKETLPKKMKVNELLSHLNFDARLFAVGVNEEVVSKKSFEKKEIREGDRVDIVHFVAGG